MTGRNLRGAMILLVAGNFLAILSDVVIKWQGGEVALLQFVFLRLLCGLVLLLPFLPMVDRGRLFAGTAIHLVRAHVGLFGVVCMVIALTSLPLATANAIFYAAPVLVMLFAVVFFGERLTAVSLIAVSSGFAGVLVMLRPVELEWAGLSALGLAAALAINALLVRKLPAGQSLAHTLLLNHLYMVPVALGLALWEGAVFDPGLLVAAFGSAFFILGYNATIVLAYRHVAASQVTSAEYTGLIWAIVLGWMWFGEAPDAWFYVGAGLIVVPLMLQSRSRRPRTTVPAC